VREGHYFDLEGSYFERLYPVWVQAEWVHCSKEFSTAVDLQTLLECIVNAR